MNKTTLSTSVLIVEDNPATLRALTRVIQLGGYQGIPRGSAEEARPTLENCRCDIAVLDIRLPGQPGDEFGRDLSDACHVPIIFVSGEPDGHRFAAGIPSAIFLQKPVDATTLLNNICSMLAAQVPPDQGSDKPAGMNT